jgi:uncharacterized protein YcfJ
VTGAVLGGVAGGIIGHQSHNTGAGVVIGALAGAVIGHEVDNANAEARSQTRRLRPSSSVSVRRTRA